MIGNVSALLRGQRGDYLAQSMIGAFISMLVLGVVASGIMGATTFQAQMAVRSGITNEASTTDSALRTDLAWASKLEATDSRQFTITVPGTDSKCRISTWSIRDEEGTTKVVNTVYNYPTYNKNTNPVTCSGAVSPPNEQVMISNASPASAFTYRNAGGRDLTFTGGAVNSVDPGTVPAGSKVTKANWDSDEAAAVSMDTTVGYTTKVATPYRFVQAAASLNRTSGATAAERHFVPQGNMIAAVAGPLAMNYSGATVFTAGSTGQYLSPTVTGGPTGTRSYTFSGVLPDGVTFDSSNGRFNAPSSWNPQVTQMSNGNDHACVLITGKGYCWGDNGFNKLGDGLTTALTRAAYDVTKPIAGTLTGKTITAISAGYDHTCAIASSRAYCWGNGGHGRLGNGDVLSQDLPVLVAGGDMAGKNVTAVSAGYSTTCAIADGDAYCWGYGGQGNTGDGQALYENSLPVAVNGAAMGGRTVTDIAVGNRESVCAIADGAPFCWGANTWGNLGNGSTATAKAPVAVNTSAMGSKPVTSIGVGQASACAVAGGTVYCWGAYNNGRLGLGAIVANQTVPKAVTTNLAGVTATQISVGYYHSCILATTGDMYCWGGGGQGRLGNGLSNSGSNVPIKATAFSSTVGTQVSSVQAGESTTCIISSGGPYCAGIGSQYRLGTGTAADALTPAPALGLPGNGGFPATGTVNLTQGAAATATTITLRLK